MEPFHSSIQRSTSAFTSARAGAGSREEENVLRAAQSCENRMKVLPSGMAEEKVTLTLDAEKLAGLRALVGAKSLSTSVDSVISAHLARLQHLAAMDEWLAEPRARH
jgi:hypothetical protein